VLLVAENNVCTVVSTWLSIEQTLRLQRRERSAPAIPTPPPPDRNWYIVTLQAWKETGTGTVALPRAPRGH